MLFDFFFDPICRDESFTENLYSRNFLFQQRVFRIVDFEILFEKTIFRTSSSVK